MSTIVLLLFENNEEVQMTPKDVKKYYKNGYQFHKETGMSHSTYMNWMKWGFVPEMSQLKLEKLTEGKLKAEWKE
jgi:hypothetical protein